MGMTSVHPSTREVDLAVLDSNSPTLAKLPNARVRELTPDRVPTKFSRARQLKQMPHTAAMCRDCRRDSYRVAATSVTCRSHLTPVAASRLWLLRLQGGEVIPCRRYLHVCGTLRLLACRCRLG